MVVHLKPCQCSDNFLYFTGDTPAYMFAFLMTSWTWHDLFNCYNSSTIWRTATYSPSSVCALDFSFLTLVSHTFYFYIMSSQIFPNHVSNISELVWILMFFSSAFASPSQVTPIVLINIISIASGRLLMKKLKDLGDRPAELCAKYCSVWRWNHWITTFSLSWYPLSVDTH